MPIIHFTQKYFESAKLFIHMILGYILDEYYTHMASM